MDMKNRKRRSAALIMLLVAGLMALAGCRMGEVPGEPSEPMPDEKEYSLVLYFANNEYLETGNEELPKLIRAQDVPLVCQEGRQYFFLVDAALRQLPQELPRASTMIDDTIRVSDVVEDHGTAIVDLSGEGLHSGSLAEAYVISQIVESLRASFPEVKQVQFLVDGAVTESLMGHYSAEEPYTEGIFTEQGEGEQ